MNATFIALGSAGCIFSGALLGLLLQKLFPTTISVRKPQDIVKLSAGTIATLTAMVLGLLISSAKNSFDTMNNGIVQSSARIIRLDEEDRREVFTNPLVWISGIPEKAS